MWKEANELSEEWILKRVDEHAEWAWKGTPVTIDRTTLVVHLVPSLLTYVNLLTFKGITHPPSDACLFLLRSKPK